MSATCNRLEFMTGVGAMALTPGTAASAATGNATETCGDSVRFCVLADIHYSQGTFWPNANREWLDRILDRAVKEKVDFIVDLGDMSFDPVKDRAYVEHYNDFRPIRTYHVLGNHEFEHRTFDEIAPLYHTPLGFYSFDVRGFRFIALDPHYHLRDGACVHYDHRCSYPEEKGWCRLPPDQMTWLATTVASSPYPCVVMLHERPESVANYADFRRILVDANAKCPGRVRLVMHGHDHRDHFRVRDGIPYFSVNSASYDIAGKHNAYPEWFRKKCGAAFCILTWNDPLSAIVTLTEGGRLRIEGTESSFYLGVTPEKAGWKTVDDRPTVPRIRSVDRFFDYRTEKEGSLCGSAAS